MLYTKMFCSDSKGLDKFGSDYRGPHFICTKRNYLNNPKRFYMSRNTFVQISKSTLSMKRNPTIQIKFFFFL